MNYWQLFSKILVFLLCLAIAARAEELPPLDPGAYKVAPKPQIDRFEFEGNTVFSDEKLAEEFRKYTDLSITSEELRKIRDVLMQHYVKNGCITNEELSELLKNYTDRFIIREELEEVLTQYYVENGDITDEVLSELLERYTDRLINSEELEQVREELTQFYIDKEYINSGAVIKSQSLKDGVLTFDIVEGQLTEILLKDREDPDPIIKSDSIEANMIIIDVLKGNFTEIPLRNENFDNQHQKTEGSENKKSKISKRNGHRFNHHRKANKDNQDEIAEPKPIKGKVKTIDIVEGQLKEILFKNKTVIDARSIADGTLTFDIVKGQLTEILLETDDLSNAVIRRQTIKNQILTTDVKEGKFTELSLKRKPKKRRLKDSFIEGNIRQGLTEPLNMNQLHNRLQLMQQNINIARVNAELKPTGIPGESLLEINLEETSPYDLELIFDNHRSASIGAERLYLSAAHRNLTGNSDALGVLYGLTRNGFEDMKFGDLQDIAGYYRLPINYRGTTIELNASKNDTLIVEEPFDQFDITSESNTYGVAIRHPLYRKFGLSSKSKKNSTAKQHRSFYRELLLSITGERRDNETFFEDQPFSFSNGAQNGETTVSVVRFGLEGMERSQTGVIAAYTAISVGLDLLDSTQNEGSIPDSEFVSWQGQLQYIHRLFEKDSPFKTDIQLVGKLSGQLTDSPLLSLEQFSLGGISSVRGYRENQVIRDNGIAGSLELRVPFIFDRTGRQRLRLAPFVDYGYGWSKLDDGPESEELWSAGVGLLFDPLPGITGQFYWGYAFDDFETSGYDLQDDGIHFWLSVNLLEYRKFNQISSTKF